MQDPQLPVSLTMPLSVIQQIDAELIQRGIKRSARLRQLVMAALAAEARQDFQID